MSIVLVPHYSQHQMESIAQHQGLKLEHWSVHGLVTWDTQACPPLPSTPSVNQTVQSLGGWPPMHADHRLPALVAG